MTRIAESVKENITNRSVKSKKPTQPITRTSRIPLRQCANRKAQSKRFRETKFKKDNCDVVNVQLRKSEFDDPITISALTFPVICSPLPTKASSNYVHLNGLDLADEPCGSENSIELLIGSDYYFILFYFILFY